MFGAELGTAIKLLRGRRTQRDCAAAGGLDPATWSLYETGRRVPKAADLAKVLAGLACSRLELEDLAWTLYRRRLAKQDAATRGAGNPSYVEGAHQAAERVREQEGDPFRQEVRRVLGHAAVLLEEALVRSVEEVVHRLTPEGCEGPLARTSP